jgi:hypothetical protein
MNTRMISDQKALAKTWELLYSHRDEINSHPPTDDRALGFLLEQTAWRFIEALSQYCNHRGIGQEILGRTPNQVIDKLVTLGDLELELGRRTKQMLEWRNLSSRESDRVDWAGIRETLPFGLETLELVTSKISVSSSEG